MFTTQHYNKIGALLGRRIAVEEVIRGTAGAVHDVVAAFVVMFNDDNSKFDEDKFLRFVAEKAEEYRATLRSDS